MKKYTLIFLSILCFFTCIAQSNKNNLAGEWKCYLNDRVTFEFLQLKKDGSGLKCFGQTINGNDTLFTNHVTAMIITDWQTDKQSLILKSRNTVSFKINPVYKLKYIEKDKISLQGEHLLLNLYPSSLNRQEFSRLVTYQRSESIKGNYGSASAACITSLEIFSFTKKDSVSQIALYKGFENLIPHIIGRRTNFSFTQTYNDPSYSLMIPASIVGWSYGFGDENFYISLNSDEKDSTETSIVIYYDFGSKNKDFYFSQIKKGKEKKDIVKINDKDVYKTINWQGKYEGKIFLDNKIFIAYYTRDRSLEKLLQKCITSFSYKN